MLSGKVLEIYTKYCKKMTDAGFHEYEIDNGSAHIVWGDGGYTHESIKWSLAQGLQIYGEEMDFLEDSDESYIRITLEECYKIETIRRQSLKELLELSEDELYEGFKTHFTRLEKCHANS
jgi:hypothetical protein